LTYTPQSVNDLYIYFRILFYHTWHTHRIILFIYSLFYFWSLTKLTDVYLIILLTDTILTSILERYYCRYHFNSYCLIVCYLFVHTKL